MNKIARHSPTRKPSDSNYEEAASSAVEALKLKRQTDRQIEIADRLEMAVRYAEIALACAAVHDTAAALQMVDKFLDYARDIAKLRKEIPP